MREKREAAFIKDEKHRVSALLQSNVGRKKWLDCSDFALTWIETWQEAFFLSRDSSSASFLELHIEQVQKQLVYVKKGSRNG